MRIFDLSCPIDASLWEPDPVRHEVMSAEAGGRHMSTEMKSHFDIDFDPAVLDDGEFLTNDTLTLTTHTGTHIDAPSHYGSRASYSGSGRPRNIDELPLDWFLRPGFVLDISKVEGSVADAEVIADELGRIDYKPSAFDIALLHTGADRRHGSPEYFSDFVGLDRSAVDLLLDLGVKVIGTDGFSLDAPFMSIIKRFAETGDRSVLWPAHFAGRDREYCQIERLAGLAALDRTSGFLVSCLPVKITGAGAGWARAVAIVDDPPVPDNSTVSPERSKVPRA
jgi:cyclase